VIPANPLGRQGEASLSRRPSGRAKAAARFAHENAGLTCVLKIGLRKTLGALDSE
jgi:hypothetical protein